jgi:hypothetical protein
MNHLEMSDMISGLTAAEWRAVLLAAAEHRCIACGESDGCECSDAVDEAKVAVTRRAGDLAMPLPEDWETKAAMLRHSEES